MNTATFNNSAFANNPVWGQLLGLCPLLAVSTSISNALGLAFASSLVLIGANGLIALLRHRIPEFVRLPCFVLIIASFTTIAMLLMQAFAFDLYEKIALFIQIIVTNCMILGRAEIFASRQPVAAALTDAIGTAVGFTIALIALGGVRELLATGGLFADMDLLFGAGAARWHVSLLPGGMLLAALPPGAFIITGLLLALKNRLTPAADLQSGLDPFRPDQADPEKIETKV